MLPVPELSGSSALKFSTVEGWELFPSTLPLENALGAKAKKRKKKITNFTILYRSYLELVPGTCRIATVCLAPILSFSYSPLNHSYLKLVP
jgi:hypothetical protein